MYTILLRNKPNKKGECPLIIRLIKDNKQKIITLPYKCLPNQWDVSKKQFKKSFPEYHKVNRELLQIETKCADIKIKLFNESNSFSVDDFYNEFFYDENEKGEDLYSFWESEALRFKNIGKISSYNTMIASLQVFKKFYNEYHCLKSPKFEHITVKVLIDYEGYLLKNGNKTGGVHFKMRYVRSVFNKAIEQNVISESIYPFKTYKLSKLKSTPEKRSLVQEEIDKVLKFDAINYPHLQESYLVFMFSILARGINFKDLILLKKSNIKEGRILYNRSKTGVPLNISIDKDMQDILNFFEYKSCNQYLFPYLKEDDYSAEDLYKVQKELNRKYNKDLRKISSILGFKDRITSYVARHTYATSMKFNEVSIEYISESMGHKNISTTLAYLRGFETKHLDEAVEKGLSIFKNK